jgi:hypothetical protein
METLSIATNEDAVTMIDGALVQFSARDLVSSTEVCNLLLDLRLMLFVEDTAKV